MIIISFGGGLGNQMYKYAFLMNMRRLYPSQLFKIDTKYSIKRAHNGYELDKLFGIYEEQCTYREYRRLSEPIYGNLNNKMLLQALYVLRKIKQKLIGEKKSFIQQIDFTSFDERFWNLKVNQSYFLYGAFANYQYFEDIQEEVKDVFKFPDIKDSQNLYFQNMIINTNSVSLHIRRGDYIQEGIGLVSDDFYSKAMQYIENTVSNAEYFVFADDIDYAKEKFSYSKRFHIVEGNSGEKSFRDMQLMSICKHNITANSTFSFWGAYLNRNPDKIVIAPSKPINKCKYPFICKDWITM